MKMKAWLAVILAAMFALAMAGCATQKAGEQSDIPAAVKVAAAKDCGCGHCAAKGCEPCHGKNCYYCAAKSLVTHECGCGMCDAKGCSICGPGCDVCKFHLAPVAAAAKLPSETR